MRRFTRRRALIAEALDDGALAPTLIARFEAQILAECGFQLDLSCCAATGVTDDLVYVSPKSGRAVSAEAGAPWRDRLLPLPPFLRDDAPLEARPSAEEIADGFRLTGFFLARDLFALHGEPLPDSRAAFLKAAQGPIAGAVRRRFSASTQAPCICVRSPLAPSVASLADLAPAGPRSARARPPGLRP